MFFYDNKILNPKFRPNWFTNVKVIKITPNPGVSATSPFHMIALKLTYIFNVLLNFI